MFKAIHNVRNQKGFTLIELLVVIAILGILAAIAIPGYLGYQKSAKERASKENFDAAYRLIKAELTKCNIDSSEVLTDAVASLNAGGKRSPWTPASAAFVEGTTLAAGQIAIEDTDIQDMCDGSPDTVQIIASTTVAGSTDMTESLQYSTL